MYQNTMKDYNKDVGILDYDYDGRGNYTIGKEGHRMLNICIERAMLSSDQLQNIEELEELESQDDIHLADESLKITLNPRKNRED